MDCCRILAILSNGCLFQYATGVTDLDGIARLYFPTSFSNTYYSVVTSHEGEDPVGLVILHTYKSVSHIPVYPYDVIENSFGNGWGINIIGIGY